MAGCHWEATLCGKWLGDSKSLCLYLESLATMSECLRKCTNGFTNLPTSKLCVMFHIDLKEWTYLFLPLTWLIWAQRHRQNISWHLWCRPAVEMRAWRMISPSWPLCHPVPPETQKGGSAQHDRVQYVLDLWTVARTKCCLHTRDILAAAPSLPSLFSVQVLFIVHDGTVSNRFNGPSFVVCHLCVSGKQNQERALMLWALFYTWLVPHSYHPHPLFPSFGFLNGKSKAPATPRSSWKVKN